MELAPELSASADLDVDLLVEAEPDEVDGRLDGLRCTHGAKSAGGVLSHIFMYLVWVYSSCRGMKWKN